MRNFTLILQTSTQYEEINNVISFVGVDSSGSFGILAGHARMMTFLQFGLSWFRYDNDKVEYLALPGGLLYFVENKLIISAHSYLRNTNYQLMVDALDHELRAEEEKISSLKESLHQLDTEMLKHLLELKRKYRYEAE